MIEIAIFPRGKAITTRTGPASPLIKAKKRHLMKFPKTTRERFLAADFPVKLHATCVDNPVDKQEEKNSFEREGESGYLRSTRRSLAHLLQASTGLGARGLGATNLDLQRQLGLDEMSGPVLFVRSVEPKTLDQKL